MFFKPKSLMATASALCIPTLAAAASELQKQTVYRDGHSTDGALTLLATFAALAAGALLMAAVNDMTGHAAPHRYYHH